MGTILPFKHQDALDAARWEVERIDRTMRGEDQPPPILDPKLEALKNRMRILRRPRARRMDRWKGAPKQPTRTDAR